MVSESSSTLRRRTGVPTRPYTLADAAKRPMRTSGGTSVRPFQRTTSPVPLSAGRGITVAPSVPISTRLSSRASSD
jgi:hypothetical protein